MLDVRKFTERRLGVKAMVVPGMVLGTVGVFLFTQIDKGSTYTDFLPSLLLLGFAIGLSVSPATTEQVTRTPGATPQQTQALVDAVHESFTHGLAHTSLIGGIIMAAGALIVLAVLPGRKAAAKHL